MYALVNGQELLLGPIGFNYRMINNELEELGLSHRVSTQDYVSVPINITDAVKILPARNDISDHDSRFETVSQFSHSITETEVVFYYIKRDKDLEQIKAEYKTLVAPERWNRENGTVTVTIANDEITVSTSRDNRLALVSKVVSGDGPYNFKFNDGIWAEITKTDLQNIITAIDVKVQEAFDWELAKLAEIDSTANKEDVYAIEIAVPVVRPEFLGFERGLIPNA